MVMSGHGASPPHLAGYGPIRSQGKLAVPAATSAITLASEMVTALICFTSDLLSTATWGGCYSLS
jgi:hypothetical protein